MRQVGLAVSSKIKWQCGKRESEKWKPCRVQGDAALQDGPPRARHVRADFTFGPRG